ncbi:hypothetical protein M8C21_017943 [Ambrosia artemisiifolia]|uniref:DUF674 family protein n=1 Tax=Ambrosia artemisiifolia TaxID=4212 RepID=A0AAD5BL16_AMBAR|nr:hypothetical protein M8C21_017943 [Ambrosia artemisiifolia]
MADTKAKEAKISLKVVTDKVNKRVVYAEADHSFVDILFRFMTLPMGTIVRLLGKLANKKYEAPRSLKNLYQSLKDFPEYYLSTDECKPMLLNPRSLSYDHCRNLKLQIDDTEPLKCFECAACASLFPCKPIFSTFAKAKCGNCGKLMKEVKHYKPNICVGGGVFVSDTATFIVTDDLRVMPYTSASSIRLLTDFGITDISCLENRKLDMGCEEILHLLKMALSLDSVFTYLVFNRTISIRDLGVPGQSNTLDQTDLMKKEVSTNPNMHLEVYLRKSTRKFLFVEAEEDLVEFLFGFLSIPLGTVVGEMLNGVSSLTCMDNIFKSISNMSVGRYIKSQDIKDMLLKPHKGQQYSSKHQVFSLEGTPLHCSSEFHKDPMIDRQLVIQSGKFIVKNDLMITPSSSYSTLSTLNNLKVSFDDIETYEISIGLTEVLRMLKASLRSCSTLTDSLSLEHILIR